MKNLNKYLLVTVLGCHIGLLIILIGGASIWMSTKKNGQNEIVFDRLWYPLSILLLAAIGSKLIGPHDGLQVDKQKVCQVTGSVESPTCRLLSVNHRACLSVQWLHRFISQPTFGCVENLCLCEVKSSVVVSNLIITSQKGFDWALNWVRLAPNKTNVGFSSTRF